MSTHSTKKIMKKVGVPPGTPRGPMGLPVSYNLEQYAASTSKFGAPGVLKSRRKNDGLRKGNGEED